MLCTKCKGKLLCGKVECPLLKKFNFLKSLKVDNELENPTPPSVFVGRIGYPKVYTGPLVALDPSSDVRYLDSPWLWNCSIEDIIRIRTSMLRTTKRIDVNIPSNPNEYLLKVQEVTASIKPIEIDAKLIKVNKKLTFDDTMQPMGFNAIVEKLEVVENPKIPRKVEKVYYDDVKATDAVVYLKKSGFSTYYLQKLLSIGMFGERKNRRLVPTRWSITAVHEMLSNWLKREVSVFESVDKHLLFNYEHFGNHFEILLSPGDFSFQLIEIWIKKSLWSPDKTWIEADGEDLTAKKGYSTLGGGYYAAKLPVLEHLYKLKKRASVLVVREVKPEYYAPLGVWVVEEGIKNALNKKPDVFEDFESALNTLSNRILTSRKLWEKHLVKNRQTTLFNFM